MLQLVSAVLLVIAVTVEARVGDSSEPSSFCTETKECLLFDLICQGEEYEVRRYTASKWVTTEQEAHVRELAMMKAFKKLFQYISGENAAGVKIDMTAPVLVKLQDGASLMDSTNYVMSFLLPSEYQTSAPEPTDSSVFLQDLPDMNVYVKSYSGWMFSMVADHKARSLKDALDKVQASYNGDYRYDAGYNSPMKLFDRHNEVWYVVTGEPVCPQAE